MACMVVGGVWMPTALNFFFQQLKLFRFLLYGSIRSLFGYLLYVHSKVHAKSCIFFNLLILKQF